MDPPSTVFSTLSLHDALPIFDTDQFMTGQLIYFDRVPANNRGRWSGHKRGVIMTLFTRMVAALVLAPCSVARSRSEEHTSELQSPYDLVCRLLLEKKNEKLAS